MAKTRKPKSQSALQVTDWNNFSNIMQNETASILTDYIRQYVGVAQETPSPGSGVFINQDRILRTQTYQELAWYDLYDELEKDPHINSVLTSSKLNVAGLDWDIIPFSDSARDKAIADFIYENFDGLENFQQDLYELMDALGKGFSISECIYETKYETRLVKLLNRPQRRIQFDATTREPKLRTISNPYYGDPLEPKKFIVHRVSSKYENPFGDALDQTIYWAWLFKKMVMKFWLMNLETATAPIPIVRIPNSASTELKAEADAVASAIRSGTYGRIPQSFEVVYAEAQNMQAANISYESCLRFLDDQITKSINGQTLTTEASGRGGAGSRALGGTHQVTQDQRDIFRAKGLASTLNSTIVRWLVDFNYGSVDGYPKFVFKLDEEIDRAREATVVKTLFDAGLKIDVSELEEVFGYTFTETSSAKQNEQPIKDSIQIT